MLVYSRIEQKYVDMMPCIDTNTLKLMGFQKDVKSPIDPVELYTIIDFENLKIQAAIQIAAAMSSNPSNVYHNGRLDSYEYMNFSAIAKDAVKLSDEVIKELKNTVYVTGEGCSK